MSRELTGVDGLPVVTDVPSCTRCGRTLGDDTAMSPGIGCSRCVPNILEIMTAIATADTSSEEKP